MKSTLTAVLTALLCSLSLPAIAAADPNKVLQLSFEAADDGFDAMRTNSTYSNWLADAIFEGLVTYDYLARPAKLIPNTIVSLPEITDGGKTMTFRLKKGIYFAPDPAFKGQRRELLASDYAYTFKRLVDPNNRSVHSRVLEGKVIGLDELTAEAKKTGKFDYDKPIAGLETPDNYTLIMRLKASDPSLIYYLAKPLGGAVAREVVELYGEAVNQHPVGTGAYMLKQYVPRSKIILEANPEYRGFVWDFKGTGSEWDKQIIKDMKGKQMPQVGRVEVAIIEEEQSRWLAFDSGQLDFEMLVPAASVKLLDQGKLKPEFIAKGLRLYRFIDPGVTRTYFNFQDPTVGGYSKDKIALRRAIALSYNLQEEIDQVWFGQAIKAHGMVPPDVVGHDASYRNSNVYDPALANKLLDKFGYKRGEDGYRSMPDGSPLKLRIHSAPKTRDYARMEIWKRSLDKIGIRAEFPVAGFADNLKSAYQCKLMMFGMGYVADIPDGIDFLESYVGSNAYRGNNGCYKSATFDEAFEKARLMPNGPERQKLFNTIERIMEADTVHSLELWRVRNWLIQPWVKGYKTHPIMRGDWRFLDVEKNK
ncbi:MAG: ABC transporter substrate-binding protein [Undibacterium umbellatum]|uniref:ABC transporter substrate-binding protein n=1 Tax=Undibacterium umbellatum TaxID=2762300 RepID=UPI003BB70827